MARERDRAHPTDAFGLPEGLLAAIVAAIVLIGGFAMISAATPMPQAEYWGALTTFALLALGVTLPGCAALYDTLGRAVRRDWRAMAVLAALVPVLYAAYALAVRELSWQGVATGMLFAAVPALAFGLARQQREPTLFDAVGLGYLIVSLSFGLLPELGLPQQGTLVTFFVLASMPLLLLLFAWRGWPGLGYSWHLSWHELRDALLAGTVGAMAMGLVGLLGNAVPIGTPGAGQLLTAVMSIYFLGALPVELLLRGGVQNGLERALRERLGGAGRWAALALTVALAVLVAFATRPDYFYGVIGAIVVGLAAGWVYQRTGKVTVSAVTHALIILVWASLMGGVAS